jgi:hypothetical protein
MNDSESFDAAPDFGPEPTDLQMQVEGLRKLFLAALVALLILGISLNVFLLRQTAFVRKDLQAVRPQVQQLLVNFQKNEEPQIKSFVNALVGFSKTHPDFKPILAKYNVTTEIPFAPPSLQSPAPAKK